MFTVFSSPAYGQLQFTPGFPQDFKGPFLQGSRPYYYAKELGIIVVQELATDQFVLQFYFFHLLKKITLISLLPQGFHSFLVHQGKAGWKQQKTVRLREGQFLLCSGQQREWGVELASAMPVGILQASFAPAMKDEVMGAFPDLQLLLRNEGQPMVNGPHTAGDDIRMTVHQILYASYEPFRLSYFFKAKVSEYLFQLLYKASQVFSEKDFVLTTWEQEAIFKIRDFILANILHHHTIGDLARRFKITPLRLKIFFKREFGVGPYTFLLNARMDKVKELMEAGKPMKEAAPLAGYLTTSFIAAFKRRYGYTPGKVFKKKKD
jgi:AraC-like DNA-binding protein